jgi:hypothetical protein
MNYLGNTEVSESEVFRRMAGRFAAPPPLRREPQQKPQQAPQRFFKPPQQQPPKAPAKGVEQGNSLGVYVLSGIILGATWLMSGNSSLLVGSVSSGRGSRPSLPESISIGGITLDL